MPNRKHAGCPQFSPKFTGKNRDVETTLDWFEVRHMSGAQGRFQSVDPGNAGANAADPQTWNAYAYVGNNPLSYTDPSGMGPETLGLCAGGPVACGIGIGIDVGLALWGIFGGGGHTPSLQNFPFPNQVPSSDPSGGYGGGSTDPFVFSFEDSSGGWLENAPAIPSWIVNGIAGAGDALSLRLSAVVRDKWGAGDAVNQCSASYAGGALAPLVVGGSRLAYAGLAKGIPLVYGAVATEESALGAYSARAALKRAFNLGMKPLRDPSFEQLATQKNGDWARIIAGAGRTSSPINIGVPALTGSMVITALSGRPSSCK
jgi:RHS repeat-associated protein